MQREMLCYWMLDHYVAKTMSIAIFLLLYLNERIGCL
uniref:Uncharacterized protein n=1 Tax=Anguilla anguilla TaxID=7936 RepID=A0A0E9QSF6_ANGAN